MHVRGRIRGHVRRRMGLLCTHDTENATLHSTVNGSAKSLCVPVRVRVRVPVRFRVHVPPFSCACARAFV